MIKDFLLTNLHSQPLLGAAFILSLTLSLMLVEFISTKYRGAKISYQWPLKRTETWDILSFLMVLADFKGIFANIIYFGFYAYVLHFTKTAGFQFSAYFDAEWPIWIKIFLAVLLYDLLFYVCHRIKHESSWLWNLHEFHHSATKVSVLTKDRGHPLDALLNLIIIFAPIQILLGAETTQCLIYIFLTSFFGALNHARIFEFKNRFLGKIFVGPNRHHMHHSIENSSCNYGEIFIFWDKLFGTYIEPNLPSLSIPQGITNNFYESEPLAIGILKPIYNFYMYPLKKIRSKLMEFNPNHSKNHL